MQNFVSRRSVFMVAALLAAAPAAYAQYYYKDIISNRQLQTEMALLKDQKIRTVSVTSFEDDGSPSEGFFCEKKINRKFTSVQMFTRSNITGPSEVNSEFNEKGLITASSDSSDISVNTTTYSYDEQDRVTHIRSAVRSSDDDFNNEMVEEHIYTYGSNNLPLKMFRVKNGTDTSVIEFRSDEKNNLAIEKDTKTGKTYYYYYDSKNRLTDIVRENEFNHKLFPDYMFEYDGAGNITQMTTTEQGSKNYYFTWKYTYSNGLRVAEKCFSKEKRLMGTIRYDYQ